ncbi:hypothetical protein EYC84_004098 [Monilinia fructicola]|uniref:2EXR domain-containing protein n=1 Tax=Monilinia fructicola TaxID=38448 RepID=A0A5M9JZ75_MONFR|nr:hypothetical protein EYC84_004098 [Monilinia fructicola]
MEAQIVSPHCIPLSQVWEDAESRFDRKNTKKIPSKPLFIAECDYQVESGDINSLPPSPSSPFLTFERLLKEYGHGTRSNKFDVAPTTFTCFKDLPAELRLHIWGMACGQQRNVNIGFRRWARDDLFTYDSNTPAPSVLYACKESRDESLKYYNLYFGTSFKNTKRSIEARPRIPCNFKADTICLELNFRRGWSQHYEDFIMKVATTDMSSLAFNIDHFVNYDPVRCDFDVDWFKIFRIVDAYEGRSSVLREIILYHNTEENPKLQPVGSEFVELDWSAMDPECEKMQQLQCVQRDLLRDFPKWWQVSPSLQEMSSPSKLWEEIQLKVKLMDIGVDFR